MKVLHAVNSFLLACIRTLCAVLSGAMALVIALQIFMRLFFKPLLWTEESSRIMMVWLVFLGAAYLHNMKVNGHIRVDLLDQILPAPASKILNIVTKISLVAILAVTAIFGFQLSMESTKITSTALDIPCMYIYGAIPVSACLMIWFSFVRLVEWIYVKTGHEDLLKAEE